VPQADPEQPTPVALQVTPVVAVPVTLAVNCSVPPSAICAEVGDMLTPIFCEIVTIAELDFVESATDVAVTVTNDGSGGVDGAV
jgi:hypothetical protein